MNAADAFHAFSSPFIVFRIHHAFDEFNTFDAFNDAFNALHAFIAFHPLGHRLPLKQFFAF